MKDDSYDYKFLSNYAQLSKRFSRRSSPEPASAMFRRFQSQLNMPYSTDRSLVLEGGVEPPRFFGTPDFESGASASSATPAKDNQRQARWSALYQTAGTRTTPDRVGNERDFRQ